MDQVGAQERVLPRFAAAPAELEAAIAGLDEAGLGRAPEEGGWTIRQIVHHVVDGDDIWKSCVKMALGNPEAVFTLQWYWEKEQLEWGERWAYARRAVEPSLALFAANRRHIVQLVQTVPGAWERTVGLRWPEGETRVSVGRVVAMQTEHAAEHIAQIGRIRRANGEHGEGGAHA